MDLARLGRIGSLQDGLVTRSQALEVLAEKQIERLLKDGLIERVHASVYAFAGAPHTWKQSIRAATLIGDQVLASHRCAAALWGLIDWYPKTIEVSVPYGMSVRVPNVLVHRSRKWPAGIVRRVDGIGVTSPARTVVDLAAACSLKTLKRAVDRAITTRIVTLDEIALELGAIGNKRKGARMLAEVLAVRDPRFAQNQNEWEVATMALLVESGLPAPERQFRIPLSASETAKPDFVYPNQMLAIEMDSWGWHGGPAKFHDDIRKRNALRMLGWTVIEFSWQTPERDIVNLVRKLLDNAA